MPRYRIAQPPPKRVTNYKSCVDPNDRDFSIELGDQLYLRRWMESYEFEIIKNGHNKRTKVEIGPQAAIRLAKALAANLRYNGHWDGTEEG